MLKCVQNPDPICTGLPSWIHEQKTRISEIFCKFRQPGIFQYPLSCDQFVNCGAGRDYKLVKCPNGTAFNNEYGVCDMIGNFECNFGNLECK